MQAPAPARLIKGGLPTEATVAHVIVGKYADHLPLYSQAQIYGRQGVQLDRSTLADWVGRAAWLLGPVHARLLERLKASQKLFADETVAPVLDPGRGRTKTGQLWAYPRDNRAWCGPEPPGVVYVYAPHRKAEQPIAHLSGFRGVLQVDGYAGYRTLGVEGWRLGIVDGYEQGPCRRTVRWASETALCTSKRPSSPGRFGQGTLDRPTASEPPLQATLRQSQKFGPLGKPKLDPIEAKRAWASDTPITQDLTCALAGRRDWSAGS